MKTSQKKKKELNLVSLLISVFSTLFIIVGVLVIYYFSKGYRLNISERGIRKTGVLTVQAEPSSAQLYINGDSIGRTPRSRTLDVGLHSVTVRRDGYKEWTKRIEIEEEKSTPVYPFLVLQEPLLSNIWKSEATLSKYWTNEDKEYFIFLLEDNPEEYSLWTYRINAPIWNLNPNPIKILTLETNNIDLNISPNGELAIFKITQEEVENTYITELTGPILLDNLNPIDTLASSTYEINWSKDNRHIIMESEEQIVSLDTSSSTINTDLPSVLLEKEPDTQYIWSTDEEGFFYLLEPIHEEMEEEMEEKENGTYIYALRQFQPDGTNPLYTIEAVYFQKDRDYIEYYRENGDTYPEFSNSPQSTQTIGEIISFEVNQDANGVYITTDTSTYWYDISTNRYRMVCAYPTKLISFSPDSRKILFANGDYIYVFTLKKEEGNHSEQLGTAKVEGIKKEEVENLSWLSNSLYIHYTQDNTLYISEKDGDNKMETINTENILLHTVKNSRDYIVTLEFQEEQPLEINQYRIL